MGIKNSELKKRLGNIGCTDWIKFAEKEGLLVIEGHGSHYANIRDPKFPDSKNIKGLITTITKNCFREANEAIFKRFLKFGIPEDNIWRGLGLMK